MKRPTHQKRCAHCGAAFQTVDVRRRFDKPECYTRAKRLADMAKYKAPRADKFPRLDAPLTLDEERQVQRAVEALREGVSMKHLRERFPERLLQLAKKRAPEAVSHGGMRLSSGVEGL